MLVKTVTPEEAASAFMLLTTMSAVELSSPEVGSSKNSTCGGIHSRINSSCWG